MKLIILFIALVFLFGCLEEEKSAVNDAKLDLKVGSENIVAGEEVEIVAQTSSDGVNKIILTVGEEDHEFLCASKPCTAKLPFSTTKSGVFSVKAVAVLSDGMNLKQTGRINVAAGGKTCVGAIAFGACSTQKPLYCDNGKLVENCSKCGCLAGKVCMLGICEQLTGKARISMVSYPHVVQGNRKFDVVVTLVPVTQFIAGSKYKVAVSTAEKIFESEAVVQNNDANFQITVGGVSYPIGVSDLNVSVMALDSSQDFSENYFREGAIDAKEKLPAPQTPQLVSAFVEGDDAILEWNRIEGAHEYRIYKSSSANFAFIAYKFERAFDFEFNSGVVQSLGKGTHFFVISAADEFGNESEYSNKITVVVN